MNPETEYREGLEELASHYKQIITLLGEDTERDGLLKTPMRVAKAMQAEICTDERDLRLMTFIMLYADLASDGLLKKRPEFARQLEYEPGEIRKYQEKSLKLIRECRFWQYLKKINE